MQNEVPDDFEGQEHTEDIDDTDDIAEMGGVYWMRIRQIIEGTNGVGRGNIELELTGTGLLFFKNLKRDYGFADIEEACMSFLHCFSEEHRNGMPAQDIAADPALMERFERYASVAGGKTTVEPAPSAEDLEPDSIAINDSVAHARLGNVMTPAGLTTLLVRLPVEQYEMLEKLSAETEIPPCYALKLCLLYAEEMPDALDEENIFEYLLEAPYRLNMFRDQKEEETELYERLAQEESTDDEAGNDGNENM